MGACMVTFHGPSLRRQKLDLVSKIDAHFAVMQIDVITGRVDRTSIGLDASGQRASADGGGVLARHPCGVPPARPRARHGGEMLDKFGAARC